MDLAGHNHPSMGVSSHSYYMAWMCQVIVTMTWVCQVTVTMTWMCRSQSPCYGCVRSQLVHTDVSDQSHYHHDMDVWDHSHYDTGVSHHSHYDMDVSGHSHYAMDAWAVYAHKAFIDKCGAVLFWFWMIQLISPSFVLQVWPADFSTFQHPSLVSYPSKMIPLDLSTSKCLLLYLFF